MRGGHVDSVTRSSVAGWAADSQHPDRRLELRIELDGREAGRVRAERPRADLAALGKYGDGAHGFQFSFPEELAAGRDYSISVRFDDGRLLPNGVCVLQADGTRAAPPPPKAPALPTAAGGKRALPVVESGPVASANDAPAPILVTAPGRSGTTYLMSCLAASPQIVVAELVPYEVRLLSYYAAAFNVLTAPADLEKSTHPDRLEGDGFHIGFNPFTAGQYAQAFSSRSELDDFQDVYAPHRLGEAIADTVREYYRRLARDKAKQVTYFAEKNNNLHRPTRLFVRRVFRGVREIVIVRDPRDVLCSHMSYFSSSRDKAFHHLSHSNRQLLALQAEDRSDTCTIRYEDMIRGDSGTYNRLRQFLGAEIGPIQSQAGSKIFSQHGTSESPEASIGRWREDLPAELRGLCRDQWGGFLERFGYEQG
jgi:hypothetical protein